MTITTSERLFERAQQSIPGGVNSPVRAFKSVGGNPIFLNKAKGAYLYDVDGNRYIDYINSWGPMILGHAFEPVVEAIREKAWDSTSFGAPTELEVEMAELVKSMVPNVDLVRMVSSGTEACMSAIRLARGFTGRNFVIKFEGCYHGHSDAMLVKAGSGVATLGIPGSAGVPAEAAMHTLALPFNDLEAVRVAFAACLFHAECMTGFPVTLGVPHPLYTSQPDLTTLGKSIGGGLPCGAFGGRADIMNHLAPLGPVYQAGTLSGIPLAMAAGIANLQHLIDNESTIYPQLDKTTKQIAESVASIAREKKIPLTTNQVG